jgi:hypothetical protein
MTIKKITNLVLIEIESENENENEKLKGLQMRKGLRFVALFDVTKVLSVDIQVQLKKDG